MSATTCSLSWPHTTGPPSTWKLGTPHTPSSTALPGHTHTRGCHKEQDRFADTAICIDIPYLFVLWKSCDLTASLYPSSTEIFLLPRVILSSTPARIWQASTPYTHTQHNGNHHTTHTFLPGAHLWPAYVQPVLPDGSDCMGT